MSSSANGYSLYSVKDFVDPNTKELNDQGRYFESQSKQAQGFRTTMWLLGIALAVTISVASYRFYAKRSAAKAAAAKEARLLKLSASNSKDTSSA